MENGQTGQTLQTRSIWLGKEKMSKVGQSEGDAINTQDFFRNIKSDN